MKDGNIFSPGRLLIAGLALTCLLGCQQDLGQPERPNIFLITIEAVRADSLGCYGYERETSPFLDSLARRGSLFLNCRAPSSWTRPSMASLFSGVWPRRHGAITVRRKVEGQGEPGALSESQHLLAEALAESGYRTIGISSNFNCGENAGINQGFEVFLEAHEAGAECLHQLLQEPAAADIVSGDKPYFLWIHYFEPHAPYWPILPWAESFLGTERVALARQLAETFDQNPLRLLPQMEEHPEHLEIYRGCYDSEIRRADEHIRELLSLLDPDGKALIIIASDHGEMFMEHGGMLHSQTLFGEVTNVPLIIAGPEKIPKGVTFTEQVSLLDIYPTILDYLGMEPAGLDGQSLLPYVRDKAEPPARPLFSELNYNDQQFEAVWSGPWKLIQQVGKTGPEDLYLYNTELDSSETVNSLADNPEQARRLGEALEKWRRAVPLYQPGREKPRSWKAGELDRLKALGYLN